MVTCMSDQSGTNRGANGFSFAQEVRRNVAATRLHIDRHEERGIKWAQWVVSNRRDSSSFSSSAAT